LITSVLLSNLIVGCGLPLSIVDHPQFRSFLSLLDPKYTPPCRQTVSYSLLPQLCQTYQDKVQSVLDSASDLSLTADIWIDRRMHAFLGVTVHAFNTDTGKPVSCLLAFQAFKGSHAGVKIAEALETIVNDCCIQRKIRSIVTDNPSNMRKVLCVFIEACDAQSAVVDVDVPTLWEDDGLDLTFIVVSPEHLPCFAHSLQLAVRDGLVLLTCARLLRAKCCKLAIFCIRVQRFEVHMSRPWVIERQFQLQMTLAGTAHTSSSVQLYCLIKLSFNDLLRRQEHENLVLTAHEYGQLQELVSILSLFSEATDPTQGDQVVTISCVVPIVQSLISSYCFAEQL